MIQITLLAFSSLLVGLKSVDGFAFFPKVQVATEISGVSNRLRHVPVNRKNRLTLNLSDGNENEKKPLDIMMNKIDIPEEAREEIFRAEANTPAAKDRNQRVAVYAILAIIGVAITACNTFLTGVREDAGVGFSDFTPLTDGGYGWAISNPIFAFFLTNKIGGGLGLLSAGFGGTMVELEQRTRNENAEKIWKELKRRKEGQKKVTAKKKKKRTPEARRKKGNKQKKRLNALSEVILEDSPSPPPQVKTEPIETETTTVDEGANSENSEGIFDKLKGFYEKADSMAASQALLLNKELEDRGVVEKITDDSGLKVIGKDAAKKLQKEDETKSD